MCKPYIIAINEVAKMADDLNNDSFFPLVGSGAYHHHLFANPELWCAVEW